MTEFDTEYRYHPESNDTQQLCKLLEERLPTAKFGHSYDIDLVGKLQIRIEAWDESHERYYNQLLRDWQEPEDIADRFYDRLRPRNTKPSLWTPS